MNWDAEAEKIVEQIPLPPIMGRFARMDAERRALQRGLATVTPEVAKAVAKGYERVFGKEATEMVRSMMQGGDIDLPLEFFEEDEEELFKVEICPAKFGACTAEKREMMRQVVAPVRELLKRLDTTAIIQRRALTPLMSHHVLRLSVIGCPNCCMSPYFADIGIICVFRPGISDGCVQCGLCVKACADEAVTLVDEQPVIDRGRCIDCGACVAACPKDVIVTEKKGYKVVAGGTGARHPQIARTVVGFTDCAGVLAIVEKAICAFRDYPQGEKEISFHEMVERAGPESLA